MTPHSQSAQAADFRTVAASALRSSAERCGLDPRGARLIRLFATAVYYLPAAGAVARIAPVTSAETVARLAASVQAAQWLASIGFPTVESLPVDQPVVGDGCAVTFWRYLPQEGPAPTPADLGHLLRSLHQLDPPPVPLPAYRPLVSFRWAIESSRAINEDDWTWLRNRCDQLLDAYDQLSFQLPGGMIHGDAWRGNLLRDGNRVVLADWDAVSTGPREIDLIPTLQGIRFGLPEHQRDAFIAAYGHDIRSWPGYPVLRDIRELSTTSALLRDAPANAAAKRELQVRLCSFRSGNNQRWTAF
jgi:aminoglycoside phosphotransferase (APT) family kinase protein